MVVQVSLSSSLFRKAVYSAGVVLKIKGWAGGGFRPRYPGGFFRVWYKEKFTSPLFFGENPPN